MTRMELFPTGGGAPEARDEPGACQTGARDPLDPAPPGAPGDRPDADAARRVALDAVPGAWGRAGDLAAHAEAAWLGLIAGGDAVAKEAVARKAAALRAEVAGPDPPPLEALLAARVVATWLQVHYADSAYAQSNGVSLRQAELLLRRMDAAHRRHLSSIAALATVRRLLAAAPARGGRSGPALALVDGPGGPGVDRPRRPARGSVS